MRQASLALCLAVALTGCATKYLVSSDELARVLEFSLGSPETKALTEADRVANHGGLAIGPGGELYVANTRANTIDRFSTRSGAFLGAFADDYRIYQPTGLLFVGNELLVSSARGGGRGIMGVLRFSGPKTLQPGQFLGVAAEAAEIQRPMGMALGPDGLVYLAVHWTDRIVRFDPKNLSYRGTYIDSLSSLPAPMHVVFGPDDNLYVTSGLSDKVAIYRGPLAESPGEFEGFLVDGAGLGKAGQLVFTKDGDLLVADYASGTVRRYAGPAASEPGAFLGIAASGAPGAFALTEK
jgi:DNA-binding beta-propeller fold protein YncE